LTSVRRNVSFVSDFSQVVSNAREQRKVEEFVLSNEMANANVDDFRTGPMDFHVGKFDPRRQKMYDEKKEDLVLQIKSVTMDFPVRNIDVLNDYAHKFHFFEDGGTDCIVVYITVADDLKTITDPLLHRHAAYMIPVLTNREEFELLLSAATVKTVWPRPIRPDYEFLQSAKISRRLALRQAWIQLIDNAIRRHTDMSYFLGGVPFNIVMIDFFNKFSTKGAKIVRDGEFYVGGYAANHWKCFPMYEVNRQHKVLDALPNVFEGRNEEGEFTRNELGALVANLLDCDEGILYPALHLMNDDWSEIPDAKKTLIDHCGFMTTFYSGQDVTQLPYSDENTTEVVTGIGRLFRKGNYPQNFAYDKLMESMIPHPLKLPEDALYFEQGVCRLYSFLWLAREDDYNLTRDNVLHLWNDRRPQLLQIMRTYGFSSVRGYVAYSPERQLNFAGLFGVCNLVIVQAKSLNYDGSERRVSGQIKFVARSIGGRMTYTPSLITPNVCNLWRQTERGVDTLPLALQVRSQKFNTRPPFSAGSKLSVHVSVYVYDKFETCVFVLFFFLKT